MADELTADFRVAFPGGAEVLARLAIPLEKATVTVLFGPSGCGKTTILRALSGLLRPDTGSIRAGGETWFDSAAGISLSPRKRGAAILLQEPSLFPHLSVEENVGFGLARRPEPQRRRRVEEVCALFGLTPLLARRPAELSGGQRQRAALARTVAPRPRLLLLDEPLSSLDPPARRELRDELKRLLHAVGTPAVVVTHDQIEALALGDRLAVVDGGRVLQEGESGDVFRRPADAAVARILGVDTVLPARVTAREGGLLAVDASGVRLWAVDDDGAAGDVHACLRAEDVVLSREAPGLTSARNRLSGRVAGLAPEGPLVRVTVDCGVTIVARVTARSVEELALSEGAAVTAAFKAPALHLVPR